jgi:hypothetical protein
MDERATMRTQKNGWVDDDSERLRKHIAAGGSIHRAAVIFKRTRSSLRARATSLGLRFPTIRQLRTKAGGKAPASSK